MKKEFAKIEIGSIVMTNCDRGLTTGGEETITKITTQFDKDTGIEYKVFWCGNHGFDSRTGWAINAPTEYYITAKFRLND